MISRSAICLATRGGFTPPFPLFYKSVLPVLKSSVRGPRRMHVASALWRLTTPKYDYRVPTARTAEAERLYTKYGKQVIQRAKAVKAKSTKSAPKRKSGKKVLKAKTATRKVKHTSKKLSAKKVRKITKAMRKANRIKSLSAFQREVLGKPLSAMTPIEELITKRAYRDTIYHMPQRVIITRKLLKHPLISSRPDFRDPNNPYAQFSRSVIHRCNLAQSTNTHNRVYRLWLLTGSQGNLSASARADMAVRLINKSSKSAARKKTTRKLKVSSQRKKMRKISIKKKKARTGKAAPTTNIVTKRKSAAAKRRRAPRKNPYLKFYRAMVLTGHIPNHPKGARSRSIKQIWRNTKHLKTIESRMKLGAAYATGAQVMPTTGKSSAKPVIVKTSAKKNLKSVAKESPQLKNTSGDIVSIKRFYL